jgi:hypothetical protein
MGPLGHLDPGFFRFLRETASDQGQYRLTARNFLLDEGIVPARSDTYHQCGAAAAHASREEWRVGHSRYLQQQVFRGAPGTGVPPEIERADPDLCPETFRHIDDGSPFLHSDSGLHLIRTEELLFIADRSGADASRIKTLAEEIMLNGSSAGGFAELDSILRAW